MCCTEFDDRSIRTESDRKLIMLERIMWFWQRDVRFPKRGVTADIDERFWPKVFDAL